MNIPRHWRLQAERLRLEGGRCEACGAVAFPPVARCAACGDPRQQPHACSGEGTVYSFAEVLEAPAGFEDQVPYLVALIQLEEGSMVSAQLTDLDPADASIGMPVQMVTRRINDEGPDGVIVYGYKFRPRVG